MHHNRHKSRWAMPATHWAGASDVRFTPRTAHRAGLQLSCLAALYERSLLGIHAIVPFVVSVLFFCQGPR